MTSTKQKAFIKKLLAGTPKQKAFAKKIEKKSEKKPVVIKMGIIEIKGVGSPIKFKKGKLHQLLDVPQGTKIPLKKRREALSGKYGSEARKEEIGRASCRERV